MRPGASVVAAVAIAAIAAAPSVAATPDCKAPPGTSAIEQYCASLPGAKGNDSRGSGIAGATGRSGVEALQRAGSDGARVLALPPGGPPRDAKKPKGAKADEPSGNPVSAVGSGVDSGGSVGGAFLWLLIGLAVALAALAYVRFRRDAPE